jgi:hypothetical protein
MNGESDDEEGITQVYLVHVGSHIPDTTIMHDPAPPTSDAGNSHHNERDNESGTESHIQSVQDTHMVDETVLDRSPPSPSSLHPSNIHDSEHESGSHISEPHTKPASSRSRRNRRRTIPRSAPEQPRSLKITAIFNTLDSRLLQDNVPKPTWIPKDVDVREELSCLHGKALKLDQYFRNNRAVDAFSMIQILLQTVTPPNTNDSFPELLSNYMAAQREKCRDDFP